MNRKQFFKNQTTGIGILMFCFFSLFHTQYGAAQEVPFIDDISYQQSESHRLAFPNGTTLKDIHAYDMPSMEYKEMSYQIDKSIDEDGNPQTQQTLIGAVNFYEDWQKLATRWVFNHKGTTQYHRRKQGKNIFYYKTAFEEHSDVGADYYEITKKQTQNDGFLPSIVFPTKLNETLDKNGVTYTIAPDGSVVTTNDTGGYCTYKLTNIGNKRVGIIKQITYDDASEDPVFPVFPDDNDPNVIKVVISVYDIYSCGTLLLSNTTTIEKEVLFNGICAKRIIENNYNKYRFDCQEVAARSSVIDEAEVGEMILSPNPMRSDFLHITLPLELDNESVQIDIRKIDGQKIATVTQQVNGKIIPLNIGDTVNAQGLYIISVKSSKYSNSKKLYYTKN